MAQLAVPTAKAAGAVLQWPDTGDNARAVSPPHVDAERCQSAQTPVDNPRTARVEGDHVFREFSSLVAVEAALKKGDVGSAVEDRERVFGVGEEADTGGRSGVLVTGRWSDVCIVEDGESGEERGCQGHGWLRGNVRISGVVGIVGVGLSRRWGGGGGRV